MQGKIQLEGKEKSRICVVIRKRPLNKKQISRNEQDVVEVQQSKGIIVRQHKLKVDLTKYIEQHQFNFDSVFGEDVKNEQLYEDCVRPIVQCAFQGAKVTCFAYGQTGSGKTYTMNGDIQNGCPGMYYLGAKDIFNLRDQFYKQLNIIVSYYEIYCGKLYDLLNNREQLQAREDGKQNVNIIGLTIKKIESINQFMETIMYGSSVRITSQNSTNSDSSRSHAILQISLNAGKKLYGKISFIDLAGCQRGADTLQQNKQTKIDGAQINKSLLALKQCIRALDLGKNHTPFRGSKLTMVLKDSFTGFCRTLMIGNVSPNSGSCENTLNTLRYADRVKQLRKNGQITEYGKQEQMARELMLPRNKKNRQIMRKNQSDEQQQILQNISIINREKNTLGVRNSIIQKITKNVKPSQPKIHQDKRNTVIDKISIRKGIIAQNNYNEYQNLQKSVNHFESKCEPSTKRVMRNKSVIGKDSNRDIRSGQINIQLRQNNISNFGNHSAQNTRHIKIHQQLFQNNVNNISNSNKDLGLNFQSQSPYTSITNNQNTNIHNRLPVKQQILEQKDYKEWNKILQKFRQWAPNPNQLEQMSCLFEQLVKFIMQQQLQISQLHQHSLFKQQTSYKQSLKLYNENQNDNKNNQEMEDYANRLSSFLMSRATELIALRDKIQLYRYHLKEHEMCQAKLIEAGDILQQATENIWENPSMLSNSKFD